MIKDTTDADIQCYYSNGSNEWIATLNRVFDYEILAFGRGRTRAEALRNLADDIEGK